jgi:uncharacterized protein YutE (UPF0331/DUF86 family)
MSNRLKIFLDGMASACEKLSRGWETQSAIECVVLSAAIIDGLLRMGLILKQQLNTCSSNIDESLLHQRGTDRHISERTIFNRCRDEDIISEELHARISNAYDRRNRCVHRYLISDINYSYATQLVFDYANLIDEVKEAVNKLEQEQIRRKVGITETAEIPFTKDFIQAMARRKDRRPNFDG